MRACSENSRFLAKTSWASGKLGSNFEHSYTAGSRLLYFEGTK